MTATVGGRYIVRDAAGAQVADVEANVQWEQWSDASIQEVIVDGFASLDGTTNAGVPLNKSLIRHNFQDTFSLRLGGSYQRVMGPGPGDPARRRRLRHRGREGELGARRPRRRRPHHRHARRVADPVEGPHRSRRRHRPRGHPHPDHGCNNNTLGANCTGPGLLPPDSRTGPDPIQPVSDPGSQQISPINQGAIKSGYGILLLGVTTWF
jgi:hypothetical protein